MTTPAEDLAAYVATVADANLPGTWALGDNVFANGEQDPSSNIPSESIWIVQIGALGTTYIKGGGALKFPQFQLLYRGNSDDWGLAETDVNTLWHALDGTEFSGYYNVTVDDAPAPFPKEENRPRFTMTVVAYRRY